MVFSSDQINNGSNLIAADAQAEAKLWKKGADMGEQTEDVLGPMEGGAASIIHSETDTAAGRGHTVIYRALAGLYGPGVQGDALFAGDRQLLEELNMKTQGVKVDLLRNGIETHYMLEEALGARGEIDNRINEEFGKWMGREMTMQGLMSMIHQVTTENHLIVNGAGTVDNLANGDVLAPDDITDASAVLEPLGGLPAYLGRDADGNSIMGGLILTTKVAARGLKQHPDYKAAQRDSGVRGMDNLIFKGGLSHLDGNVIKDWNVIDPDGFGPAGSPLNPKAYLGVKIIAGTTASMTAASGGRGITGGKNAAGAAKTKIPYFRFFPKHAFAFVGNGTLSTTASTHFLIGTNEFYVRIINSSTAADEGSEVIRNKWGIFKCSANGFTADGNELTVSQRLGPNISGIAHSTVGNVTYNSDLHTETFLPGALVVPCNKDGVILGRSLALYRRAMRRAHGMWRNKRMTDTKEGIVKELYIASIFGQKPRENVEGKFPGIVVINHALEYPGWNCKTV